MDQHSKTVLDIDSKNFNADKFVNSLVKVTETFLC